MREEGASALPEPRPLTRRAGSGGWLQHGGRRGGAGAPASVHQCACNGIMRAPRGSRLRMRPRPLAAALHAADTLAPVLTPPELLRAPPGGPRRGRARRQARRRPRPAPRAPPRRSARPRRPGARPSRAPGAPPRRPPRAPPPARCGLRARARGARHPAGQGRERRPHARRLQARSPDMPSTSATNVAAACAHAAQRHPPPGDASEGRMHGICRFAARTRRLCVQLLKIGCGLQSGSPTPRSAESARARAPWVTAGLHGRSAALRRCAWLARPSAEAHTEGSHTSGPTAGLG